MNEFNALLGNTTSIVSTPVNTGLWKDKVQNIHRKWRLKTYAEKLMRGSRTDFCMRYSGRNSGGVGVYYNQAINNAHYQGLAHCDNPWLCPVCSATMSARRADEVRKAIDAWPGSTVMITYTMQHHKGNDPDIMICQLRDALRKLYKDRYGREFKRAIGWAGTITNLDITYHERAGWHLHIHQLVFLNPENTTVDVMNDGIIKNAIEDGLRDRWITALESFGATGIPDVALQVSAGEQFHREYVAKFGKIPELNASTLHRELTQSTHKTGRPGEFEKGLHPFQILELSKGNKKSNYAWLWSRYQAFTFRRNQLTWSPGLKAFFGIDDIEDHDLIEDGEDKDGKTLVTEIEYMTWEAILHYDARAELLGLVIRYDGNVDEITTWLDETKQNYLAYMERKSKDDKRETEDWAIGSIFDKRLSFD